MTVMADKEARCLAVEALVATGRGVIESCREVGISESVFQRWKRAKRQGAGN
ncbi:transposase [Sphingomonas sp.]|uniref:transposase n=1 Tax=Sphingomonas sp. TaxID=28214 RepID=UPI0025ED5D00|nr:transposase [Sphingomonas sp.]